uniref:Uncharacterized protein n=1 Tax=Timema bartmani TaxID=61472 RepID=A0A7R9F9Y3_9NEOP|nr:unnamed protein product [Timema bartmani]
MLPALVGALLSCWTRLPMTEISRFKSWLGVLRVPNLVGDFKDTINYGAQRFQISDAGMKSPWDVFLPIKEQIKVPNLVGDFKDTINYGAQRFQISDAGMKSPWDVFLPIKEQIKDETDTSNSVDEIVKTEIKLYDSSLGIMNSNMDPVDKSKIKLEQDQSTSSSEISQSNILAQTGSDFPHEGGRKCNTENCTKKADEDIVFHMEAERNVKLQDVLNRLRQEAIVLYTEAERNLCMELCLLYHENRLQTTLIVYRASRVPVTEPLGPATLRYGESSCTHDVSTDVTESHNATDSLIHSAPDSPSLHATDSSSHSTPDSSSHSAPDSSSPSAPDTY